MQGVRIPCAVQGADKSVGGFYSFLNLADVDERAVGLDAWDSEIHEWRWRRKLLRRNQGYRAVTNA